jgi:hypothetical protein
MKTPLLITVDCGKTTCGKCNYLLPTSKFCYLFAKDTGNKRCPACLRAEKEAKHDKEIV